MQVEIIQLIMAEFHFSVLSWENAFHSILTCHNRKTTGVTNNINSDGVPVRYERVTLAGCPSKCSTNLHQICRKSARSHVLLVNYM